MRGCGVMTHALEPYYSSLMWAVSHIVYFLREFNEIVHVKHFTYIIRVL